MEGAQLLAVYVISRSDSSLNGGLLLKTLALLCFVKLAATIVSYASGNAGGIFAPSLYIGAMAGGAIGLLSDYVCPRRACQ